MTSEEVRAWRERHGLSVAELASMLGIDRTRLWRWEKGNTTIPAFLEYALNWLDQFVEVRPPKVAYEAKRDQNGWVVIAIGNGQVVGQYGPGKQGAETAQRAAVSLNKQTRTAS